MGKKEKGNKPDKPEETKDEKPGAGKTSAPGQLKKQTGEKSAKLIAQAKKK